MTEKSCAQPAQAETWLRRRYGAYRAHHAWRELEEAFNAGAASAKAAAQSVPTPDDIDAQEWAGMDGTIAFHLIDRHGEDWSHIGRLMEAWRAANPPAIPAPDPAPDHLELFKEAGEWAETMKRKITPDMIELLGWLTGAAQAWAEKVEAQAAIPAPEGADAAWLAWVSKRADMLRTAHNENIFKAGYSAALAAPAPQDSLDSAQPSKGVAMQVAPAWQPIETAPKDGTRFLAMNDGWHEFFHWQDGANEHTKGWPTGWRSAFTVYREGTGPTHWMPLPAAPQTKEPKA